MMTSTPRSIVLSAVARLARFEAGYSVAETARVSGVSEETIRRIEAGTSEPRRDTVLRVLSALDPAGCPDCGDGLAV